MLQVVFGLDDDVDIAALSREKNISTNIFLLKTMHPSTKQNATNVLLSK